MNITRPDSYYMPKVLICSDDLDISRRLIKIVENLDATADVVLTEKHALDVLSKARVELLVVDVDFNTHRGHEFVSRLRESEVWRSLPVVVLTSDSQRDSIEQAYRCGATDFVAKPLDWEVLRYRLQFQLQNQLSTREIVAHQEYLDKFDPLTGLYNRQHFTRMLRKSMERTAQRRKVSALLLIDIDNFKRINSSFNYQSGDGLLKLVGQQLAGSLRGSDLIMREDGQNTVEQGLARLGGDEFTLFVEDIGAADNAVSIAKRCLENIGSPLELNGQTVVLTASVGIAIYPQDGSSVDTLMKNAERAMYNSKEHGGGCYTSYSQEMNVSDESSFILENDLRDALQNEQLALHYQPQIDAQSGKVVGMEVLLRWHHPMLGMVSPERFIPIAESSGLIVPIGEWVLQTACHQAKKWLDEGRDLKHVAVNVSPYQFYRQDFVKKTLDAVNNSGLPPQHLELELTESLLMSDAEENIAKLESLKAHGIALAIDDFGTGYSSLSYLRRLPIDTLKIDRSFVANISDGSPDGAIVSAILALASKLDLQVVAEGVEDLEQMQFLKDNQCDILQGYLFSAACPHDEAGSLLDCAYLPNGELRCGEKKPNSEVA